MRTRGGTWGDTSLPGHDCVSCVLSAPGWVFLGSRGLPRHNSVPESGFFERSLPALNAAPDVGTPFQRSGAVDPDLDWSYGFGYRDRRVLFLQAPANDIRSLLRSGVVAIVPVRDAPADAVVAITRLHWILGQLEHAMMHHHCCAAWKHSTERVLILIPCGHRRIEGQGVGLHCFDIDVV